MCSQSIASLNIQHPNTYRQFRQYAFIRSFILPVRRAAISITRERPLSANFHYHFYYGDLTTAINGQEKGRKPE